MIDKLIDIPYWNELPEVLTEFFIQENAPSIFVFPQEIVGNKNSNSLAAILPIIKFNLIKKSFPEKVFLDYRPEHPGKIAVSIKEIIDDIPNYLEEVKFLLTDHLVGHAGTMWALNAELSIGMPEWEEALFQKQNEVLKEIKVVNNLNVLYLRCIEIYSSRVSK